MSEMTELDSDRTRHRPQRTSRTWHRPTSAFRIYFTNFLVQLCVLQTDVHSASTSIS